MAESILGAWLFGESPKDLAKDMPAAPKVDISEETGRATKAGLANMPKIEELAGKFNDFSSSELSRMMEKALPGYADIVAKGGKQVASLLSGELPKDVDDYMGRKRAELGVMTGARGSDFEKFGNLRDLGMASLQAINQGFDSFSRWVSTAAKPHLFDFSALLPTTAQSIAATQWNEQNRFSHDWLKTQLQHMPEPWENAARGFFDWIATTGETIASAYAWSATGVMGGMGGGGGGSKGGSWNDVPGDMGGMSYGERSNAIRESNSYFGGGGGGGVGGGGGYYQGGGGSNLNQGEFPGEGGQPLDYDGNWFGGNNTFG